MGSSDILSGETSSSRRGLSRDVVKYISFRLCEETGPELWDTSEHRPELEHIKQASEETEDRSNKVHAFGNLLVLERKHNNDCKGKPHSEKLNTYRTPTINGQTPKNYGNNKDWETDEIEKRTNDLIDDLLDMHDL